MSYLLLISGWKQTFILLLPVSYRHPEMLPEFTVKS